MYTACIVEPRKHSALSYVLHNFVDNLSTEWNFIIFHGNKNIEYLNDIFITFSEENKERMTFINLNVDNLTNLSYSKLLKTKEFYEYIPTETFLIFQTDTIILPQNKELIYDFLEYDYVGAPWPLKHVSTYVPGKSLIRLNTEHLIGNGGLSLRKKSKMLSIIDRYNDYLSNMIKKKEILKKNKKNKIDKINKKIDYLNKLPEDLYFSCNPYIPLHLPSRTQALSFSVELIYNKIFFGCHKPWLCNRFMLDLHPEINELYNLQNNLLV
jgi:hypothetical protein